MILYVKHVEIEGPETLGDFFTQQGFQSQTVDLWRGDSLPVDIAKFQAIVVLGGPMNVYEEEKYPFLRAEDLFIKKVMASGIPFLGLCLGAQLLAKAGGAKVGKSPQKEIGFSDIVLTKAGKKDFLFQGVGDTIKAFQWHEDTFAIPSGSKNLASSVGCPHQAFRLGQNAYGFQFHVEINEQTILAWTKAYNPEEVQQEQIWRAEMLPEYRRIKREFEATAQQIYRNFLVLINKQ
jgi:GMP synthase (glutamine-hydrolysing)